MAGSNITFQQGDGIVKGVDPAGQSKAVAISGPAIIHSELLAADATWSSGWLPCERYKAMLYAIQSDQPSATSGVTIEYSDDGVAANAGGISRTYNINPNLFQTALTPKPNFVRLTYKNGSQAQGSNYILILLSDTTFQGTMSSVTSGITGTNLATITKSVLELPDSNGTFSQLQRTGTALNVSVANPQASVSVSNFPATQPISGTVTVSNPTAQGLTDTQLRASPVPVNQSQPSSATVTSVTTTASSTTILAANTNRKGVMINSVSGTILVKMGTGASATSYTARLVTNGYYEFPQPVYTGVVTAIGAGSLTITETV